MITLSKYTSDSDTPINDNLSIFNENMTKIENWINNLDNRYPVGSIYISVSEENPSNLLGGGVWEEFAAGRLLIGVDTAQQPISASEKLYGSSTVTLIADNLPEHTHDVKIDRPPWNDKVNVPDGDYYGVFYTNEKVSYTTDVNETTNTPINIMPPVISVYMWKRVS